jgi:hypothetical protein
MDNIAIKLKLHETYMLDISNYGYVYLMHIASERKNNIALKLSSK